ncbi:hypothetical protein [Limnohabitans sp.]|uniref:hypothetical protein n=1 Tax=Limnohabitans sp. TaxID=1907725 RepID=UPI00286F00BA|nr:hypothetical protein [Limnohabitans sp.]
MSTSVFGVKPVAISGCNGADAAPDERLDEALDKVTEAAETDLRSDGGDHA